MDSSHTALAALEEGLVAAPVLEERPTSVEVARRWAVAMGLRRGNCTPIALSCERLIPLIDVWAAERGWSAPGRRDVGIGLALAGVFGRRARGGPRKLLLHRDDSVRLQRMAREAGTLPLPKPRKPLPKLKRVKPVRVVQPLFHEELARGGKKVPLCDSIGRVWPSAAAAAAALSGESSRSLSNRSSLLRQELAKEAAVLSAAAARAAMWRGVWWRRLTAAEVANVPQCARVGDSVPGLGWGLTCVACGVRDIPAWSDGAGI